MSAARLSPREQRVAKPGAFVAKARLPIFDEALLDGKTWTRLCQRKYMSQFFPSPRSRMTPDSWEFPCCYLGADIVTTTAEVIGDRLALMKKAGRRVVVFPKKNAMAQHYLRAARFPKLKLCNLTDSTTRLALNYDGGALETPDLSIPQSWAQAIAVHENLFDGILYRSRHTDQVCVVLWNRKDVRTLGDEIPFEVVGEFYNADAAHALGHKMGIRVSFAS